MLPGHRHNIYNLVDNYAAKLKKEVEMLYYSKEIEVDEYDQADYRLAKVLITAAIRRTKDSYAPLHSEKLIQHVDQLTKI